MCPVCCWFQDSLLQQSFHLFIDKFPLLWGVLYRPLADQGTTFNFHRKGPIINTSYVILKSSTILFKMDHILKQKTFWFKRIVTKYYCMKNLVPSFHMRIFHTILIYTIFNQPIPHFRHRRFLCLPNCKYSLNLQLCGPHPLWLETCLAKVNAYWSIQWPLLCQGGEQMVQGGYQLLV